MQMDADREILAEPVERALDHLADLGGNPDADRIGKADFLGPCFGHRFGDIKWARNRHGPFERATETRRNRHLHFHACRFRERNHRAVCGNALGDRLPLIGDAEAVRCNDHASGFIDPACPRPRCNRALHAAHVHAQRGIADTGIIGQPRDDGFGIGHLRHALGIGKARDFDPPRAIADCAFDKRDLVCRRHDPRFILKPVTRGHFKNLDGVSHGNLYTKCRSLCIDTLFKKRCDDAAGG